MDRHVAKKADQPKIAAGGRRAFDRELVSFNFFFIIYTDNGNKFGICGRVIVWPSIV